MGTNYYIKLRHDTLHDPAVGRLPDGLKWRYISLLLVAGEYDSDGRLPGLDDMLFSLHLNNVSSLVDDLETLRIKGLIGMDHEGYFIPEWEDTQGPISGAERTRRWREAKAKPKAKKRDVSSHIPEIEIDHNNNGAGDETSQNSYAMLRAAVCTVTRKAETLLEEYDLQAIDRLFQAGYTADQVHKAYTRPMSGKEPSSYWFVMNWKGQRGQAPTLKDIVETIGTAVEWDGTPPPSATKATGNGRNGASDKQAKLSQFTTIVSRYGNDYNTAKGMLEQAGLWPVAERMGKWNHIRRMDITTQQIEFYKALNSVGAMSS